MYASFVDEWLPSQPLVVDDADEEMGVFVAEALAVFDRREEYENLLKRQRVRVLKDAV